MGYRKAIVLAVVAVALMGLLAVDAWAGCGSCGPKSGDAALTGTVKSLCTDSNTLVLTTGSGDSAKDVKLNVCSKGTKVVIDGKAAKLADVKTGAKVKVGHKHTKKGLFATSITIGGASA